MPRIWMAVGIGALLLRPAAAALPQSTQTPRQVVEAVMTRAAIPGLQAAVAVDGRMVWSEGFGLADIEQHVAVTRATRFRIGSVSKAFTAAALARLVDDKRIDLDAPIQRYVPAVPSGTMTVRQVAGHLSGIRNYRGQEFVSRDRFDTVAAATDVFVKDPLLSPPGAAFAYSSYNYVLLSAAIEAAAGRPYLEYLDAAVLTPLQLRATAADVPEVIMAERARWYEASRSGVTNAPFVNLSNKWAAGGLLSTAEDVVRLALAVTDPAYLSPAARQLLLTSQRTTAGAAVNYGIGWRTDPAGSQQVWHGGEAMGARAFVFMDVPSRSVVTLACNLGGAPFDETVARALLAAVRVSVSPAREE